jgi:hypothetical protein
MRQLPAGILILALVLFLTLVSVPQLSTAYAGQNSKSVIILAKHQQPDALVVSGGYVYWMSSNALEIDRVLTSSGEVQTVISTNTSNSISGFTVSSNFVFWGSRSDHLYKTNILNNRTSVLCKGTHCSTPSSILASGNYVFFVSFFGLLMRVDTDGSHLANITPRNVTFSPDDMTISSGFVYWSSFTGQVGRVSFSGTHAKLFGPNYCESGCGAQWYLNIHAIIVVNSHIYWTTNIEFSNNNSEYEIVSSILTSGGDFKILFENTTSPYALASVASVAYHDGKIIFPFLPTYNKTGFIYSVPSTGGVIKLLATHYALDSEVTLGYLYFGSKTQIDKLRL